MIGPIPLNQPLTESAKATSPSWRAWLSQLFDLVKPLGGNGTTANRPIAKLYVGLQYFDTSLGKPVFVKTVATPAVWVDATGAVV